MAAKFFNKDRVAIENFEQNFLYEERERLIAILDHDKADRKIKSKYLRARISLDE
ncbi:MAG: hypothetical protein M3275_07675 [Thermoproteota archaeon]|nr:hypothetical protein [Thermoproteota archaeon]